MSLLAVLALAIGVADLARARRVVAWPYAAPLAAAAATVVVAAALAGLTRPADLALLAVALATASAWVVLAGRALEAGTATPPAGTAATGGQAPTPAERAAAGAALGAVGLGSALLVALSGAAGAVGGPLARWLGWTQVPAVPDLDPTRALLLAGLLVVQLATGNVVVRLALLWSGGATGTTSSAPSQRLRGGRLLGPMERLFIVGLGLSGQLTAASLVVAAKGLIRWPELQAVQRGEDDPGIDAVTEYFLVGSFVSWLVALASLGVLEVV